MWGDLEAHWKMTEEFAVDLHMRVAVGFDGYCFDKLYLRIVARHAGTHCVR